MWLAEVKAKAKRKNQILFSKDCLLLDELCQLMEQNKVTEAQIRKAVASRGYYPEATPIKNYDPDFVSGVLVGAWPQVYQLIKENN